MKLRVLSDPLAEGMSDKQRLDAFVKVGVEAADEIERLWEVTNRLTDLVTSREQK